MVTSVTLVVFKPDVSGGARPTSNFELTDRIVLVAVTVAVLSVIRAVFVTVLALGVTVEVEVLSEYESAIWIFIE